jgi:hypothetical protein
LGGIRSYRVRVTLRRAQDVSPELADRRWMSRLAFTLGAAAWVVTVVVVLARGETSPRAPAFSSPPPD